MTRWWKGQKDSLEVLKDLHKEIDEVYHSLAKLRENAEDKAELPKVFMLDYDRDVLNQNVSAL